MSAAAQPTSNIPLWGQAWELVVTAATATGASTTTLSYTAWQPEALRITFEVVQAMNTSPIWYADIAIYNQTDQEAQNILLNATWATLKAGFQDLGSPSYMGTIWDGPVFQTLYTRENVVDTKVTLHCVVSPLVGLTDTMAFAVGPFASQTKLLAAMAGAASLPPISSSQGTAGPVAQSRMDAVQYPRGNTVFGKISKYLTQIADSNFLQTWNDGKQVYISEAQGGQSVPNLIYSPPFPTNFASLPPGTTQSLIGTPQQVQQGCIFTVLLDPRLKVQLPPLLVQLVRTFVNTTEQTPDVNNSTLPTALQVGLTFFVQQVKHTGDTRGNDWTTEVTGYSTAYSEALLNLYIP